MLLSPFSHEAGAEAGLLYIVACNLTSLGDRSGTRGGGEDGAGAHGGCAQARGGSGGRRRHRRGQRVSVERGSVLPQLPVPRLRILMFSADSLDLFRVGQNRDAFGKMTQEVCRCETMVEIVC